MTGTSRSGGSRKLTADRSKIDDGPSKPKGLPAEVSQKWDEIVPKLHAKVLREIDYLELVLLAELSVMADRLAAAVVKDPGDHKSSRLYLGAVDRIHRLSAAFGLNPADRKRLDYPVELPHDEASEFIERRMNRGRDEW